MSGVDIRHRAGYCAIGRQAANFEQQRDRIFGAMYGPLEAVGVGVTVDARTVQLERQCDRWTGNIEILIVRKHREGKSLSSEGGSVIVPMEELPPAA